MKPFRLQNCELAFPKGWNSISQYFFSQNPNQFILFQYANVYLCAKFGDLKPTIHTEWRPQILHLFQCFCARHRINIPQGVCNFLLIKCFINVNWSSWSTDCTTENLKPQVMLRDMRGPNLKGQGRSQQPFISKGQGGSQTGGLKRQWQLDSHCYLEPGLVPVWPRGALLFTVFW